MYRYRAPETKNRERLKETRKKRVKKIITYSFLCVAVVLFLGIFSSLFSIKNITIIGDTYVTKETLLAKAGEVLQGKVGKIFSANNFFFVPEASIESMVTKSFPEIKETHVSKTGLRSLSIVVKERVPLYRLCNDMEVGASTTSACHVVDSDGFIFTHASTDTDALPLITYTIGGDTFAKKDGDFFEANGAFFNVDQFYKLLVSNQYNPVNLRRDEVGVYRVNVFQNSFPLIFDGKISPHDALIYLQSALGVEPLASLVKNKNYQAIEYIDLRFSNKVFYKLKGGGASVVKK